MSLRISGKNLDVGDAFRGHVETRLSEAVRKYFDGGFTGHVTLEREGSGFRTECTIHLDTGIVLQAEGRAAGCAPELRPGRRADREAAPALQAHASRTITPARREETAAGRRATSSPRSTRRSEVAADYNPTIIAEETTALQTTDRRRRGHGDGPRRPAGARLSQCRPRRHQRRLPPRATAISAGSIRRLAKNATPQVAERRRRPSPGAFRERAGRLILELERKWT